MVKVLMGLTLFVFISVHGSFWALKYYCYLQFREVSENDKRKDQRIEVYGFRG
jgi:hypothetical protein